MSTCSVALEKGFSANLSCWIACFLNFIFCCERIKWNIVIASDLEFYFHRRLVPSAVAILGHHHRRSSSTTNAIACHRRLSLRHRGLLSSLTVSIVGDYYPRWLSLPRPRARIVSAARHVGTCDFNNYWLQCLPCFIALGRYPRLLNYFTTGLGSSSL